MKIWGSEAVLNNSLETDLQQLRVMTGFPGKEFRPGQYEISGFQEVEVMKTIYSYDLCCCCCC